MDIVNEVLFDLIRKELTENKTEITPDSFSNDLLSELFTVSGEHSITPLIADFLIKNNLVAKENVELYQKYWSSLAYSIMLQEKQDGEISRITELFEENEIAFIPLKGAILRNYYPEKYLRTSCDIDILVKENDCQKAAELLVSECKYKMVQSPTGHDLQLYSPSGVHIELHYKLLEDGRIAKVNAVLSNIFNYTFIPEGFSYKHEMTGEIFIYYHIVHMIKHFLGGGCGIRPFIDLWLMNNKMRYDEAELLRLLEETGIKQFYNSCLSLISVWFEEKKHSCETQLLEEYIINGGVYGTTEHLAIVKTTKKNKLHMYFTFAFPPYTELKKTHANLAAYPILLPFYYIIRFFKVLDIRRYKRLKSYMNTVSNISEDDTDKMNTLLKTVGL